MPLTFQVTTIPFLIRKIYGPSWTRKEIGYTRSMCARGTRAGIAYKRMLERKRRIAKRKEA